MKRLPSIGNGAKPRIGATWASGFKLLNQSIQKWISEPDTRVVTAITTRQNRTVVIFSWPPRSPADNNQAERSLRLAVTQAQVSGVLARWIGLPRRQTCWVSCRLVVGRGQVLTFFERLWWHVRVWEPLPLLPQPSTWILTDYHLNFHNQMFG